jgi:hypothetical protein
MAEHSTLYWAIKVMHVGKLGGNELVQKIRKNVFEKQMDF